MTTILCSCGHPSAVHATAKEACILCNCSGYRGQESILWKLLENRKEEADTDAEELRKLHNEVQKLQTANKYKAQLLEETTGLIARLVKDNFDTEPWSDFYKDKFRDVLTKTWSD